MTIKEIESLSGMTRANIRFYESAGLLSPVRKSNGYRDYSENDLEVLKRIRLLRTLNISLEEIKSLDTGERELADALEHHLAKLDSEKADIEQSRAVCIIMRSDGVSYKTLNAQHYLDEIENITQKPVPELATDTVPKVRSPLRRFFARQLDLFIYSVLWLTFLSLAADVYIGNLSSGGKILVTYMAFLLMLFVEPALLALFGTTVGKWILGLRITDIDNRHLSYYKALSRTWTVFLRGMGLHIPIYRLVRLYKSLTACDEGETLDWEYDSTISLRDKKAWRIGAFIGACAILLGILFLMVSMDALPPHRGEITAAEFCENYNWFSDYYELDNAVSLEGAGKRVEGENTEYIIEVGGYGDPELILTETDGIMTGLQFSAELHTWNTVVPDFQNERILSTMSFVRAQTEYSPFSDDTKDIIEIISESPYEDFQFTVYDISITCDVEYSGYMDTSSVDTRLAEIGEITDYSLCLKMIKE